MRWSRALIGLVVWIAGCGLLGGGKGSKTAEHDEAEGHASTGSGGHKVVAVDMPWETTKGRDDPELPVLNVVLVDNGADGVPVPYLYGYPLYAEGDARRGIVKLRHDNYEGATRETLEDENGVVHVLERLPKLGCEIEGIQESETQFVPMELRCELPPPRELGGGKRPVLGSLQAGASPAQVLKDPSITKAFYGQWHLAQGELKGKGDGLGYFNTDHGQLAFGFARGKLVRIAYYFDPPVKNWRDPSLWAPP